MNKYINIIDKFSLEEESESFITNINSCVNDYKDIASNVISYPKLLEKNNNSNNIMNIMNSLEDNLS